MPFTLRRSSAFRNGSSLRYSTIAFAFDGPIPGSRASSSALATLMSTRAPGADAAATPRPLPASTRPQRSPAATTFVTVFISTSLGASAAPQRAHTDASGVPPRRACDHEARSTARNPRTQRRVAPRTVALSLLQRLC